MRRLSVVVPTLDTLELTSACVASVRGSRLSPGWELEIVVVDDGSRDGTAEVLPLRDPGLVLVRHPAPQGYSRAVNAGVARTSGELLLLLNSDTVVRPDSLAALLGAFESEPGLGIAGGRLLYPDGREQWSGGRAPSLLWLLAQASGLPPLLRRVLGLDRRAVPGDGRDVVVDWVSGAALALRREVWEACGPLETSYRFYAQDLDLSLAARDAGWGVRVVGAFEVVHHHGATIAGQKDPSEVRLDLGLLWPDLVLWARRRGGAAFEARCRRAIAAGAALRLLGRWAATPFLRGGRRKAWAEETARVVEARRVVRPAQEPGRDS